MIKLKRSLCMFLVFLLAYVGFIPIKTHAFSIYGYEFVGTVKPLKEFAIDYIPKKDDFEISGYILYENNKYDVYDMLFVPNNKLNEVSDNFDFSFNLYNKKDFTIWATIHVNIVVNEKTAENDYLNKLLESEKKVAEEAKQPIISSTASNELSKSYSTTLTASTLILNEQSAYDINVLNKQANSTFKFKSSDTSVAVVNSTNGIVKAVNEGDATITCEVTTPTDRYSLTSEVTVTNSEDENYPTLNETDVTLEVNDLFDLDVENYTVGSKIRYTSSNKSIATVTSTSGKVTGISVGEAIIKCIITSSDKTVTVLTCKISVTK